MRRLKTFPALMGALALAGCATTSNEAAESSELQRALNLMAAGQSQMQGKELEKALAVAARHPLGSNENPVRASMPAGQRAYLSRLRCADGRAPAFERQGNLGPGVYGNIVDAYAVVCTGKAPETVVMDMYHSNYVEDRPVPGFTIVAR